LRRVRIEFRIIPIFSARFLSRRDEDGIATTETSAAPATGYTTRQAGEGNRRRERRILVLKKLPARSRVLKQADARTAKRAKATADPKPAKLARTRKVAATTRVGALGPASRVR
jgi:hypothetical protein